MDGHSGIAATVDHKARRIIDTGVWFQSCSGLWYDDRGAAGSIVRILVDGQVFEMPEKDRLKLFEED